MISRALSAAALKPFILSILAEGESYGYEIIQRVHDLTEGEIRWTTGTLYPLLHNLENKGLLVSSEREAGGPGPKRKYYRLTPKGEQALAVEKREWLQIHHALTQLWGPTPRLAHV